MTTYESWEDRLERRVAAFWRFLGTWWQQIAITQAGIYLVASFGQGHNILPAAVAWGLALGMEGTYLRGLIDAGHVRGNGRRWATALIIGTYATIILWGIAYILGLPSVGVIPAGDLGPGWGIPIAVIHVLPVAYTGLCAAMLHRARTGEEAQRRATEETEAHERARRLQAQLDEEAAEERAARRALEAQRQLALNEIEAEKQKALARLEYRQARVTEVSRVTTGEGRHTASGQGVTGVTEAQRALIVTALRDNPKANKSQLATAAGVGRGVLYKVIDQAIAAGELPPDVKGA